MACPECHHEREEASVEAYRHSSEAWLQSLRDNLSGVLCLAAALVGLGATLWFFVAILFVTSQHQSTVDFAVLLAIIVAVFLVVLRFNRGLFSLRAAIPLSDRMARLWSQIRWR